MTWVKPDVRHLALAGVPARPRILAVDDQCDYLEALEALLSGEGYEVLTTTSTAEALKHARDFSPDVLVTDLNMSPCDGVELLKILGEHGLLPGVPRVILSSAPPSIVRGRMREGGVDAFVLDKNGDVAGFLAAIEKLCRERTLA